MDAKVKLLGALIDSRASLEVSDEALLSALRGGRNKIDSAIESWGREDFEKNADQAISSLNDLTTVTSTLYTNGGYRCRALFEEAYGKAEAAAGEDE